MSNLYGKYFPITRADIAELRGPSPVQAVVHDYIQRTKPWADLALKIMQLERPSFIFNGEQLVKVDDGLSDAMKAALEKCQNAIRDEADRANAIISKFNVDCSDLRPANVTADPRSFIPPSHA